MDNNKIALYRGNNQTGIVKSNNSNSQKSIVRSNDSNCSSGIVKSNNGNNQKSIVKSNEDVEVNILTTLDADTLDKTKRIRNQALAIFGEAGILIRTSSDLSESERKKLDFNFSDEDKREIAAATRAEEKQQIEYLKQDGVLQVEFLNESQSNRTKSKKKSAKEEQQIATDNLIHDLKIQKQVIKDFLAHDRLGEPEREIIKDILDEEATEYSTYEDIELILQNYLTDLNQKIESLNKTSIDADYRKRIQKIRGRKRWEKRIDESALATHLALSGNVPTLEKVARRVLESENDTSSKELTALNQYEGNVEELIEVFVISLLEPIIDARTDNIQRILVPINVDIEEFVAARGYKPYLYPAFEECQNKYALTAFSPINGLAIDIGRDRNGVLSVDGFNGYRSINPNNNLHLDIIESIESDVTEARLLSSASDVKLLPAAEGTEVNNDNNFDNSSAIVLAENKNTSALNIIPTTVSTLDNIDNDREALENALINPESTLRAIVIENNLEQRNSGGFIVKSNGEEVLHPSCKALAAIVLKNTEKIEPLFFGQLVEGDASYYDHVNNTTRVFVNHTGETVTYEGLVKLGKFATESEIAVDEDKVLEATIKDVANVAQITKYDGPSLQLLKNKYQLTVADAQDIITTYWDIEQNNKMRAHNTVLSDEEYETYRESKSYGTESNIICESDLLSISESSIESLKDFFKYVDDNENAKSVAIKELETLLSAIREEQAEILNTPPFEIPDLIEAMTHRSNEVEDIKEEITNIVNDILQKHYQCDLDEAREMLALYPAVETILDIGTESDESGNETFNLPSDIWTNEDYRYEEWNGQRELLPFPSKQEYKKFVGFIKGIRGDDKHLKWDSIPLMINLERTLELLNSQDLEAAREFQIKIDEKARVKAQRKVEESEEVEAIEELSSQAQELPNVDIQKNNNSKNNLETELDDSDVVEPKINVSQEDIQILERILQKKIKAQKMAMKDRMVWAKYFESVSYESVEAETISRKIEQMKTLLF